MEYYFIVGLIGDLFFTVVFELLELALFVRRDDKFNYCMRGCYSFSLRLGRLSKFLVRDFIDPFEFIFFFFGFFNVFELGHFLVF